MKVNVRRLIAGLAVLASFAAGCGAPGLRIKYSSVRTLHALILKPTTAVDFHSRDNLNTTNIPLGGASQYLQVPQGGAEIAVTPTGSQTVVAGPTTLDLSDTTKVYTIAASGVVGGQGPQTPTIFRFLDQFPTFTTGAAVRLINLSPDSQPVSLYNGNQPVIGLTNVAYGNATRYVVISPAGSLKLQLVSTTSGAPFNTATLAQGTTLADGRSYSVVVVGLVQPVGSSAPLDAVVLLDN